MSFSCTSGIPVVEVTIGDSEESGDRHLGPILYIIDKDIGQDSVLASNVFIPLFLISAFYVKEQRGIYFKKCGNSQNVELNN